MAQLIATSNSVAPYHHVACYHAEASKCAIYMDDLDPNTGDGVVDENEEYHRWEANGCVSDSYLEDEDDDWSYAPDLVTQIEFSNKLHQAHVTAYWDEIENFPF